MRVKIVENSRTSVGIVCNALQCVDNYFVHTRCITKYQCVLLCKDDFWRYDLLGITKRKVCAIFL